MRSIMVIIRMGLGYVPACLHGEALQTTQGHIHVQMCIYIYMYIYIYITLYMNIYIYVSVHLNKHSDIGRSTTHLAAAAALECRV